MKTIDNLMKPYSALNIAFEDNPQIRPSNKQLGVAFTAGLHALKSKGIHFWIVGAGKGKSRIIAALAMILLEQSKNKNSRKIIDIVFASKHLLDRDKAMYQTWMQQENLEENIKFHCDCSNLKGDYIILDEADYLMIDHPNMEDNVSALKKFRSLKRTVIGFSATDTKHVAKERKIFDKELKVKQYSSGLVHEVMFEASLVDSGFFNTSLKARKTPMLIYTTETEASNIEAQYQNVVVDKEDYEFLRQLDQKTEGLYPIVLVTNSSLMRGVDYRSQTAGITLFMCVQVSGVREAQQALARVGRNGDKCWRYKLHRDLVDLKLAVTKNQILGKRSASKPLNE